MHDVLCDEELLEKETTSKEPNEQNTVIKQSNDGFIPVTSKRAKKKTNKKTNERSSSGNPILNAMGLGNAGSSSGDSYSSTTTDKDRGELDFHGAEP